MATSKDNTRSSLCDTLQAGIRRRPEAGTALRILSADLPGFTFNPEARHCARP